MTDEAGNTPRWVPLLGLVLLLASVAAIVVCHGNGEESPDDAQGDAAH